MNIKKTKFKDVFLIKKKVFRDNRGYFYENYNQKKYLPFLKKIKFVQDNISFSKKNVLRGLHFQKKNKQGKLLSVISGSVLDVIVDLRINSLTYKKWQKFLISDKNCYQIWIPPGFAHGFLTLQNNTIVSYKCTKLYDAKDENTIKWNDPILNIKWKKDQKIIISKKDKNGSFLKDLLPF
jgi:dTDP-4-dehydrorhamnose 3,5-epimerase